MATKISRNYSDDFDEKWYVDTYYSKIGGCEEEGDFLLFALKALHEIFHKGQVSGKTLLDIGTGPTVHSVFSACQYVQEIYLSDIAESNRNTLQNWCDGKLHHGKEICEYILNLEDNNINKTVEGRFEEIRKKVKAVLPIDVTKQPPISQDIPSIDIVLSSLCFEAASVTVDEYTKIVQNISGLLTSGGHLVIAGVLDQTFYRVGDFKFECVKISQADLQHAYTSNGFKIKTWKEFIPPTRTEEEAEYSDFQKAFVMHAMKT